MILMLAVCLKYEGFNARLILALGYQYLQKVKKLYVGNLSYNTTDASLKEAFSEAGTVSSATVIIDKMSGRSRGFGFVEMENDDEATKAVETMNGKEVDGRAIVVNEARPMTERAPRRSFGGGSGGSRGGFGGGSRGGFGGGRRDEY